MWLSRRAMLRCSVVLLGVTRTLWASTALPAISYRDLTRPVTVPLGDVSERWQFVEFDAWAVDASGGDLLLKGVLVRTQLADDPADGLVAFCLACPHEICYVGLVEDSSAVELDVQGPDHPLFVCPCHFSAFDPCAEGERLGGPTPRGLFRFRVELAEMNVRIAQVEEAVLQFLA